MTLNLLSPWLVLLLSFSQLWRRVEACLWVERWSAILWPAKAEKEGQLEGCAEVVLPGLGLIETRKPPPPILGLGRRGLGLLCPLFCFGFRVSGFGFRETSSASPAFLFRVSGFGFRETSSASPAPLPTHLRVPFPPLSLLSCSGSGVIDRLKRPMASAVSTK